MLESINNEFQYTRLTEEEQQKRGILGRLKGIIADFKNPTRNGRYYSEELWNKVFADPLMEEKIANKTVFGELGHPADRSEIDMEKIAICLAEKPKKGKDGKLYGIFDILNTPNGKILKTLCDYGCKIGISSRGNGDIQSDFNGNESVDPDTFELECWDAVLLPAVKDARLTLVNESLDKTKINLKQALNEALEKASPEAKKVMTETLSKLNLLNENLETNDDAAKDIGAHLVNELQESLLAKQKADSLVLELQEKLSVSYAKEAKYEEDLSKYRDKITQLKSNLNESLKLQENINSLKQDLNNKDNLLEESKKKSARLIKEQIEQKSKLLKLSEQLNSKEQQLRDKCSEIDTLNENLTSLKKDYILRESKLKENINSIQQDLIQKTNDYSSKLNKANTLVEKYKSIAKKAVNRYIESRANILGVSSQEIKNRLPNNYSFEDIDSICENLNQYKLNLSKLPIQLQEDVDIGIRNMDTSTPIKTKAKMNIDEVDDSLLSMANLN